MQTSGLVFCLPNRILNFDKFKFFIIYIKFIIFPMMKLYQKKSFLFWQEIYKIKLVQSNNQRKFWDFPCGPVVKNLLCNARNPGSIPGWGAKIPKALGQPLCFSEISHAARQLSPRATTRGPACCNQSLCTIAAAADIPHLMQERSPMLQLRPDAVK